MCYYNGMRVTRDQFIRLIGIERELKGMNLVRPVANGFDYRSWPIVRPTADRKSFTVKEAHWEFIPEYIEDDIQLKEARKHQTWLNAKGENLWVNEKGKLSMWSEAAEARRCLVLSSHFFEFRHVPVIGNKGQPLKKTESIPYCITLRDRPEYFFMAGIWRTWTNHARGQSADTFAIVTAPANEFMAEIHNTKKRMPVIMDEDQAAAWLKHGQSRKIITELATTPYDPAKMIAWTVAKDFKNKENPEEPFHYSHVAPIEYAPN